MNGALGKEKGRGTGDVNNMKRAMYTCTCNYNTYQDHMLLYVHVHAHVLHEGKFEERICHDIHV